MDLIADCGDVFPKLRETETESSQKTMCLERFNTTNDGNARDVEASTALIAYVAFHWWISAIHG